MIKKVHLGGITTADLLMFAQQGDTVESSRAHVGPTTASLPHFYVSAGTSVRSQLVDTTFGDNGFKPHCSISQNGTVMVGDPTVITFMMKAHTSDRERGLQVGDLVSNWHLNRLSAVFSNLNIVTSSSILKDEANLLRSVLESSWDLLSNHETHGFRHYIESDGTVTRRESPASVREILDDLSMVTGEGGWKIPNIVTIVMDILLGSKRDTNYYHLCGPSMWKYIDEYDYQPLIDAILSKMKRFGRDVYLVNAGSFRVFSLVTEKDALDEVWSLWKKHKLESCAKKRTSLQAALVAKIRAKKLPWYDKCEGEKEITQHDLGSAADIHVPNWAIYANFEELSEFVAYTVKCWKSRKN